MNCESLFVPVRCFNLRRGLARVERQLAEMLKLIGKISIVFQLNMEYGIAGDQKRGFVLRHWGACAVDFVHQLQHRYHLHIRSGRVSLSGELLDGVLLLSSCWDSACETVR